MALERRPDDRVCSPAPARAEVTAVGPVVQAGESWLGPRVALRATAGVTTNLGFCTAVESTGAAASAGSSQRLTKFSKRSSSAPARPSRCHFSTPWISRRLTTSRSIGGKVNSSNACAASLLLTVGGTQKLSCAVVSLVQSSHDSASASSRGPASAECGVYALTAGLCPMMWVWVMVTEGPSKAKMAFSPGPRFRKKHPSRP